MAAAYGNRMHIVTSNWLHGTGHKDRTSENAALDGAKSLKYLFIQASTNSSLFAAALEPVFVVSSQAEDRGGVQEGVSSC